MEQRATRLLAGTASFGADTTVLMDGGMVLAFCRADAASFGAGHQLRLDQHRARLREARDDAGGGEAYVRAVEAGTDAADEVSHMSLAQACVGTRDASAAAVIAGRSARLDQRWVRRPLRVGCEDGADAFHDRLQFQSVVHASKAELRSASRQTARCG